MQPLPLLSHERTSRLVRLDLGVRTPSDEMTKRQRRSLWEQRTGATCGKPCETRTDQGTRDAGARGRGTRELEPEESAGQGELE